MKIENSLKTLGFSDSEARIYSLLVEAKRGSAGDLIKETGFHRNVVYTALSHLINRKLVSEKITNSKKVYSAESPDILFQEIQSQSEVCRDVIAKYNSSLTEESGGITVHEGNEEFLKLLLSIISNMKKGEKKYVLGAGGEDFMEGTMRPIWKKYHKQALESEIKISMIAYEDQKKALLKDVEKFQELYDIKFLEGDDNNPGGIHIYPSQNTILNIIYSDQDTPVVAIKIINKKLTAGYMKLFNTLWG